MWMLVDRGEGGAKIQFSCGRHIWMAPKGELERGPAWKAGPRPPTGLIRHRVARFSSLSFLRERQWNLQPYPALSLTATST